MILIEDDITNSTDEWICHGVNTLGYFNAGVAKAIRHKWPIVYKEYFSEYKNFKLGEFQVVDTGSKKVVNLFTQKTIGYYGKHASLEAITISLYDFIQQYHPKSISISKIGCSLGGLDWVEVKEVLEFIESETGTTITVFFKEMR